MVAQRMAPARGDPFWNAARPRSLSGEDQLVTVFSAVSSRSPRGTWGQALCVPAQGWGRGGGERGRGREETKAEAKGLAPRGTRPLQEAACSLGARWSQGRRRENMTPGTLGPVRPGGFGEPLADPVGYMLCRGAGRWRSWDIRGEFSTMPGTL